VNQGNHSTTCTRCGNPVQPRDQFCGNCGAAILPPAPQAEQVIPRPTAAPQAPSRSNRKPLFLAGAAGLMLLLLVGGGAIALFGSGGEEIELARGVYSKVPEGWAVAAVASSTSKVAWLVPEGYENQDLRDFGDSPQEDDASSEEADIVAGADCIDIGETLPPDSTKTAPVETETGFDKDIVSSGSLAKGEATVAGHAATWNLVYVASAMPWYSPDLATASEYPTYFTILTLHVCVEDPDWDISMNATAHLTEPSREDPDGGPTAERNASVPKARNEVHEELNRRYEANIGAMTDLLEAVDAEGLFNGGRTDLSAIPTSLDGVDAELSNPFGGPLEGFANTPDPTSSASSDPTASASPDSSASPEPVASASPDSSASPSSEEEILEEFGREYDEASRREDWAKTYSMLDESSQQEFTEGEWAEKMQAIRDADGPPPPLADVIVEQNTEVSDSPATITFVYEDGSEASMQAMIPMVVEDPSDSGVPKRFLSEEELAELEQVPTSASSPISSSSSSASPANLEAEAEEAAGDYYRAAGSGDWSYTYEHLDTRTQSLFTQEEWFEKNQWFANNGEVTYHILSADMVDGAQERLASVTLRLTYEDGSSSTRTTYFVYEYGSWKHRFGQEEYDLFMPDLSYEEFVEAKQ
jgi:hypothetical protein